MTIRCIGTGDAFGSGGRLNSCFLLHCSSRNILLDFGASSLIGLKKYNIPSAEIDVIVISHLHGDHFGGIPFLIRETQVAAPRKKPLTIIGPPGITQRIADALQCFFPARSTALSFKLDIIEFTTGEVLQHHDLQLLPLTAIHTEGTSAHSLRLMVDNKVLAYTGDTAWNENLIKLALNADVMITEGYTFTKPLPNHIWVWDLINNKHRLRCKQLLLTHASRDVLDHRDEIPFTIINDGDIFTV